ncbi:MAG: phosphotransferase [Anaerolineae bacterium]|nr:phosphotransferase [Anaerolineae bacterium]
MTTLDAIQRLQFNDRQAAEALLLEFMRSELGLNAVTVELRPLAVSLNSFNGFVTLDDGTRLFFKTHTESDTIIAEYYNAVQLAEAGYPVLQPIHTSTEAGRQLLIYPVVDDQSVFDVAWAIEQGDLGALAELTEAQQAADDHLMEIYAATLALQGAAESAAAPVHQLFHHRLAGGRLERFYGPLPGVDGDSPSITLPDGAHSMREIRQVRWTINGRGYDDTLDDLIRRALLLLEPAQPGPSIVGHGDAHNGNVFFLRESKPPSLMYFDPAFAGRHHPLLDLAKPLFHNVFAMWMYHAQEKADALMLTVRKADDRWAITHDYTLPPVRTMFWTSKVERVLLPVLDLLKRNGMLHEDWRDFLKAAFFCCPLLTINLADETRFPRVISLLGVCMAVELGSESRGERSLLDRTLDEVEHALR